MSRPESVGLSWRALLWQRPLDPSRVAECLRLWATDTRSPLIVLEARASRHGVSYWLGTPPPALHQVAGPLRDLLGTTVLPTNTERMPVTVARRLTASTRHRPLRLDDPESIVRAILGALTRVCGDETLVLQLLLGPRCIPLAVPNTSPSSVVAPWWQVAWRGDGGPLDGEKRSALRTKVADHGFAASIRLGVAAEPAERRRSLLLGLLAALRTSEAAGIGLGLTREPARRLNTAARPWYWPLRLGVPELLPLTGWPLGEAELPGQPALHPKPLPPAPGTTGTARVIARATAPGVDGGLALDVRAALQHLHVIGPTGVGKSTLLAQLIVQDIQDGRAVVVVEPKGDLVADVLARVPAHRRDDVMVLDPSDGAPVGLNPLALHGRRPEVAADSLLAVFKGLYGEAVGPRSADILYAGLLTLAHRPDTSLAMLPLLLTNPGLRRGFTANLRDPLVLEPFWATYETWSEAERAAAIAPVMNKLRPLLRPGLRGVIGQPRPRFGMQQVLTERRVLLVPLQRGVIGPEAAGLLGALVLAELWQALQSRGAIPAERRHPVMVYVDEVQDYLHLPTDLGEALAQARGYGAGFTLGHQYLAQLPREMAAAVLANARSRVCFTQPPADARVFAQGHPELLPADLEALGPYEVYASLLAGGRVSPYASGRTQPLPPPTTDPDQLRERSRQQYGQSPEAIEADLAAMLESADSPMGATGRRRRQP